MAHSVWTVYQLLNQLSPHLSELIKYSISLVGVALPPYQHGTIWAVTSMAEWAECFWEWTLRDNIKSSGKCILVDLKNWLSDPLPLKFQLQFFHGKMPRSVQTYFSIKVPLTPSPSIFRQPKIANLPFDVIPKCFTVWIILQYHLGCHSTPAWEVYTETLIDSATKLQECNYSEGNDPANLFRCHILSTATHFHLSLLVHWFKRNRLQRYQNYQRCA